MSAHKLQWFPSGVRKSTLLLLFAIPAFPDDQELSAPALPPAVADKLYSTAGRIAVAGEQWRACITAAGVDYTQLRDIRARRIAAQASQDSIQGEIDNAGAEARRLGAVTPRTPDIQRQIQALEGKWVAINAQKTRLAEQIKQLNAEETQFQADLEKQKSCMTGAPATLKSLMPAERAQ